MTAILTEVDPWLTAAALAVAMLAGWGVGWRRGRRLAAQGRQAPASKCNDASLAILGLLLAFTFSLALAKHDSRRQMLVADSNAIGDFSTCVSLLDNARPREELKRELRAYVQLRLSLAGRRLTEAELQEQLAELQAMQNRMQGLVGDALRGGTPLAVPLVNTFNGVTSSHAARLAALRDRLPPSIVAVLLLAALFSMVLLGAHDGVAGERPVGATVGFAVLVSLIVWVTLDLNQPQRGLITVSQEPLQRVLAGMGE